MMSTKPSLWVLLIRCCISLAVLTLGTPLFGQFVYVANYGDDDVSPYMINASSGALTPIPGSPFADGSQPVFLAVDPTGKFAYVVSSQSNYVSGYKINASTGALTPVPGSPFAAGSYPFTVAVDPTANSLMWRISSPAMFRGLRSTPAPGR